MMAKLLVQDIPVEQPLDIIQRCISGERAAQSELFHRYSDAMFTVCYRILGDKDLAADALQESFIEVFRQLHTFRQESTPGAWIKTITIRSAIRKRKTEYRYESIDMDQHDQPMPMYETVSSSFLEKVIMELPPGYRHVFCLIEIEGYKHREVAEILSISENTSRSQLFHAKKMLQEKLKQEAR